MASIIRLPNGRKAIQLSTGKRPKIHLGKLSLRQVEPIKRHVEHLERCQILSQDPSVETCQWLAEIDDAFHERLADLGLAKSRQQKGPVSIDQLTADFIRSHEGTVKPATVTTWKQAQRLLREFFGGDRLISSISTGDARDFRNYLKTRKGDVQAESKRKAKPLSEATTRRRCLCAKQMFAYAVDKRWVDMNPSIANAFQSLRQSLRRSGSSMPTSA